MSNKSFYTDEDYEPGTLKMNFRPKSGVEIVSSQKKRKFAGMGLEVDPFTKKIGIGFHFKTKK